MMVQLNLLGVSVELARGVLEALTEHNAAWWRRERDAGREHGSWLRRLRYRRPPIASIVILRDAATILPTMDGGCFELCGMFAGWLRATGRRAELDDARITPTTWHARVLVPTGNGTSQIWDPERNLPHVA